MSSSKKTPESLESQTEPKFTKPTFGILQPPRAENPDELHTLAEWGYLPKIVSVPNAAAFLAHACNQNYAALLKIIVQAIRAKEIRFWGLSHSKGWTEGMVRFLYPRAGKPRIRPSTKTQPEQIKYQFDGNGRLHIEAMGINPLDAINLLKNRGRKVPEALLSLLITEQKTDECKTTVDDSVSGPKSKVHTIKKRNRLLSAEIEKAKKTAMVPTDTHSVWTELVKLAEAQEGCLLGLADDEIKYNDGKDICFFSKGALQKRLNR